MNSALIKKQMVEVARTAFMKGLTAGWGGNISFRLSETEILISPHKVSLGFITEEDILSVNMDGVLLSIKEDKSRRISTESQMHLALYKTFDYKAIIHLHPPCINSIVAEGLPLMLSTYESSLTLGGTPPVVPQKGPTVTDLDPLIKAFNTSSIVILEKHGIVAAGDDLSEAFSLADVAEEAARMTINRTILKKGHDTGKVEQKSSGHESVTQNNLKTCKVFTDEHMKKLQELINGDEEARKLGYDTDLTVNYAIKQQEDGKVYNMHFNKGELLRITDDEEADFINVGKREIWINVFNGRLDPFAATSQKKLRLVKGHIGDLSKWYAPFYRIFDLWKFVPVQELHDE